MAVSIRGRLGGDAGRPGEVGFSEGAVVARRRGFFAEMNHQAQLAERRRQQAAQAYQRQLVAAQREAERAARAADRARAAATRADASARRDAEREAARLRVESGRARVSAMNAELARTYEQIDGLLAATLEVDDFVNLERLRITRVDHPPFQPGEIGQPLPQPPPPVYPPAPQWYEPPQPSGLSGLVGGRRRYEDAVAVARMEYDRACLAARQEADRLYADYQGRYAAYQAAEQRRLNDLDAARRRYEHECHQREIDAAERNAELDNFIHELAFDVESAIDEYVRVVLSNSVYPEAFSVRHEHEFDLESRELTLNVVVPPPSAVPTVREYRYVQARDEVTETALPVREQKSRYASAVWQVAIRSLHEVFEADRAGKIRSIALTVATTVTDPATGLDKAVSFVLAAADRETFIKFDLANVIPAATLEHLGAAVSKSPFDLLPADTSRGVRTRNR